MLVADGNVFERDELIKCFEGQTDVEILPPVEDGQSVLDVLSTQRVDILLMDTILPKLDGLAVLAKMRQIDMIKRPMVFITSIFVTENLLFEFQKYGVIYRFARPVSAMNVMSQVIR
ncbi:MAG: response regulator, partial [Eubacteriales bacterium]|nr:response regulator [Eubacteriales bacterium]